MPTLQEMLKAKQQSQKDSSGEQVARDETALSDSGTGKANDTTDVDEQPVHANQPDELAHSQAPAQPTKPGGIKLGGLRLGGTKPTPVPHSSGSDRSLHSDSDQGRTAGSDGGSGIAGNGDDPANQSGKSGSGGLSLIDLAGLGSGGEDAGEGLIELSGVDSEPGDGYLDEVPATAPDRRLPDDMTEQMQGFINSLDAIYSLHDDREMFANMVRKIMSEMQDNPALVDLLADEDSNALIRGLRQHAGLAQVKKQEAKTKRGSGKQAKPQGEKMDSIMATLQGLAGFDGPID